MTSRKIASIENLHCMIDDTSEMIGQKTALINRLQRRKVVMIETVESTLKRCRDNERILSDRWQGKLSNEGLTKLEEYNMYLSQKHDEGSAIISQINAAKNFQQLERIERVSYEPFITEVSDSCSLYYREIPTLVGTQTVTNKNSKPGLTHVETRGVGRTNVDIKHKNGISVTASKESVPGSPGHKVNVSTRHGAIKVSHRPDRPVSPGLTYVPSVEDRYVVLREAETRPVEVREVREVKPVAVAEVQEAKPVEAREVREVQPVAVVREATPVRTVQPVAVVREATPVRTVQPVTVVREATPVRTGVITHDYYPRTEEHKKLSLPRGTPVTILRTEGDWYYVQGPDGRTGYVSRNFVKFR
jgi:hypothetical protein